MGITEVIFSQSYNLDENVCKWPGASQLQRESLADLVLLGFGGLEGSWGPAAAILTCESCQVFGIREQG